MRSVLLVSNSSDTMGMVSQAIISMGGQSFGAEQASLEGQARWGPRAHWLMYPDEIRIYDGDPLPDFGISGLTMKSLESMTACQVECGNFPFFLHTYTAVAAAVDRPLYIWDENNRFYPPGDPDLPKVNMG